MRSSPLDPAGTHARRSRVARHFDRLLLADPDNLLWLTGYRDFGGRAYLALSSGRWFLLAPQPDMPPLQDIEVIECLPSSPVPASLLRDLLSAPLPSDAPATVSAFTPSLETACLRPAAPEIELLRQIKEPDEIALIGENVRLLSRALHTVETAADRVETELELWQLLEATLVDLTGGQVELEGNLSSGQDRTRDPDPHATDRLLRGGDPILLDAYPRIRGYYADLTRTWYRGAPHPELERMHAGVAASLQAVAAALRPGMRGHDLDHLARQTLAQHGLDATFPHHTGHGFGVKQQEEPWLRPGSNAILAPNMIVAVEPACYVPGLGGVRLEQDFLITATGSQSLEVGSSIPS